MAVTNSCSKAAMEPQATFLKLHGQRTQIFGGFRKAICSSRATLQHFYTLQQERLGDLGENSKAFCTM
jgi:hypothetical protein